MAQKRTLSRIKGRIELVGRAESDDNPGIDSTASPRGIFRKGCSSGWDPSDQEACETEVIS